MAAVKARKNLVIHHYLVHVVPHRYIVRAFDWLYSYKGKAQSLGEFFKAKKFRPLDRHEQEKILKGTPTRNMDISLLYKLFTHVCDIPSDKSPVKAGQEPSLGQVLYQLKDARNNAAHMDPEKQTSMTENDLDTLAKQQRQLLTQMLTLAGRMAQKSELVIKDAVSSMVADVDKERRAEVGITVEQFVSLCRQELLRGRKSSGCPYVEPRLVVKTSDVFISSVILLRNLFSYTVLDGSRPQVIQVTGEAGAGKTSLCRAVLSWWLMEEERPQALEGYQLVLSITCARVNSRDLHRYLRTWVFPDTARYCEDTAILTRLLGETKILWLVDGWDEATREARSLMEELLHSRAKSHTVLVTCRPEFSASLAKLLGQKVLNVSFAGLDEAEMKELIRGLNLNNVGRESLELFLSSFHRFLNEGQDLSNPLMLSLLAEQWCRQHQAAKERRSLCLVQIYQYRTQRQREDLIARCQVDAAPGQDVAHKIDSFLRRLYEVAFNSAKSGPSLILDDESVNTLLKECGDRATFFLSTFLEYVPGTELPPFSRQYTFSHESQRCFYAARHLECCCEGAADAEAKLREILEADSTEPDNQVGMGALIMLVARICLSRVTCGWIFHEASRISLYQTVLWLLRKFAHLVKGPSGRFSSNRSGLVPVLLQAMEMWAEGIFQASVSARFLVDMLASLVEGDRDPAMWLEVVRRCGDKDDLVKKVSLKINTKFWVIVDGDIRAATKLLQHVTPAGVAVFVSGVPEKLPHLCDLLSKLAELSVSLELHLLRHYDSLGSKVSSDKYLGLICREETKCRLKAFTGHLSDRGLSLTAASHLSSLRLRITRIPALHELTVLTPQLTRLTTLELVYDSKKFVVPRSSLDGSIGVVVIAGIKSILTLNGLRALTVHLQLPHLRESSVNAAIGFISELSKKYMTLSVGKLDHRSVKTLVAGLNNNAVSVGDLRFLVYVKEYGRDCLFSLGTLPLSVPLGRFVSDLHDLLKDPFRQILLRKTRGR